MNCLEFRRICIATSDSVDEDFLAHKQQCPECAALAEEMGQFDRYLNEAMVIDPPSGLASRILLRQSLFNEKRTRRQFYFAYALAASLVLALGVTFSVLQYQGNTLDEAVIAYIINDLEPRRTELDIQSQQLQSLFNSVGMKVSGNLGTVNYARRCYIRDQVSLHLVLAGSKGPVTVIVMPEDPIENTIPIEHTYFNGIIVPCPKGSMAIVGEPGESLNEVETKMREAVTWF